MIGLLHELETTIVNIAFDNVSAGKSATQNLLDVYT